MSNVEINELPPLKVNVPSFLVKTYEILENDSLSHIITWNKEGNAFIVLNSNELAQKVLANYFKHKNYPSFLRQLNMYNFKKTKNQYGQSEFKHKWFRRGLKSMLQYIRRRNQDESEQKLSPNEQNNTSDFDTYKKEHQEMKQIVKEIQQNQYQMNLDFQASMEQNASVSRQNSQIMQCIQQMQMQFNKKFDQLFMYFRMISNQTQPIQRLELTMGENLKQEPPSPTSPFMPQDQYNHIYQSPYHHPGYQSPIHYLFQKQNIQDYCYQIDQNIFSYSRQPQQQQLALPAPQCGSYAPSNIYSHQSSLQSSPFRTPNPPHSTTDEDKISLQNL